MSPTQLDIKVKSLQRLLKEEKYYLQEIEQQKKHINQLSKDENLDPYELKKQREVLQDTERLLPVLYRKINEFKDNLNDYLQNYDGNEETLVAMETLNHANELLGTKA